jgi:hypothetical protein
MELHRQLARGEINRSFAFSLPACDSLSTTDPKGNLAL